MKKSRRLVYSSVYLLPLVAGGAFSSSARADPSLSPRPITAVVKTAAVMKKSEIPLSVLKDIGRVHLGMTRAELEWLFFPDGGLSTSTQRSYIYRYAGVPTTMIDPAGKPILDKVTHQPLVFGQAIKIDVKFKPAAGRGWEAFTDIKTGHPVISADGRPDDVIVSISDPYAGFEDID